MNEPFISERMRESAIKSAPGPVMVEENGIMAFVFCVPEAVQIMRKRIDQLTKENSDLNLKLAWHCADDATRQKWKDHGF